MHWLTSLGSEQRRSLGVALLAAAAVCGVGCASPSETAPDCAGLTYGTAMYESNMARLARLAHLREGAWNRNHETAVDALCRGSRAVVDGLVADHLLDPQEADRIASVLGKRYAQPPAAEYGADIAELRSRLRAMGLCSACADNVARFVARAPDSACAKLARRALDGDAGAVQSLLDEPPYCVWAY